MTEQPLWTYADVARATGGLLDGPVWTAAHVTIDSRGLKSGDLFFAIQGLSRDGHEFVEMAEQAHAAAVVISRGDMVAKLEGASVLVEDTLKALEDLGRFARQRTSAKVVAITGSVGKTGTKEALRLALGACGQVHASEASYNNLWGVPLSLARMPVETEFGIFEIGMNHPGEIVPLTKMVSSDVAIVTNVAPVHLEFFEDEVAIADAKGEIFEGLKPGGTAIINRDMEHFERLRARAEHHGAGRIIGFGTGPQAEARLIKASYGDEGSDVEADICGTRLHYKIGAPGQHWVLNSLAVLAGVEALGADLEKAARALSDIEPPKGRGERHALTLHRGGDIILVDESYNANPASMRAALATLGGSQPMGEGRRIAVLGDMRELGAVSEALHVGLADAIKAAGIDLVYCCGPDMAALWEVLPVHLRGAYGALSSDLTDRIADDLKGGDIIMIKGSLGTNMAPIVKAIHEMDADKVSAQAGGA